MSEKRMGISRRGIRNSFFEKVTFNIINVKMSLLPKGI